MRHLNSKGENRRRTREVFIGSLGVGGNNPVRIKGMIKSPLNDFGRVLREVKALLNAGAEAIRVAVKKKNDVRFVRRLKEKVNLPFVADIHFDYHLALAVIDAGIDSVRLNPMNIFKVNQVREVVRASKKSDISIRIGVNSGGFKKTFRSPLHLAEEMVEVVSNYIKIFEKEDFFSIMVSLKTSDVASTILANRIFSSRFSYPLHLGVTATGPFWEGVVKSSLGLGILLSEGIGDVVRVSLTGPSVKEIEVARYILQASGVRRFFPEIISCPTCSRCEVNLPQIVEKFKRRLSSIDTESQKKMPEKVAIMGCIVNGPGEAYQADIGVAFGNKMRAAVFKKDKILAWTDEGKVVDTLIDIIRKGESG